MKKLNDEQLSRVLSAHEDGMLKIADELDFLRELERVGLA